MAGSVGAGSVAVGVGVPGGVFVGWGLLGRTVTVGAGAGSPSQLHAVAAERTSTVRTVATALRTGLLQAAFGARRGVGR